MKTSLSLLLSLVVLGTAHAQTQQIPPYFGFYILNIPGFTWAEGATVQGEYKRYTGVLNMEHSSSPVFVSERKDPVPLSLNQASALLLETDSKKPFDLVGVEGRSLDSDGTSVSFFVPFYAEVNGQRINLVPTMTSNAPPAKSDSSGGGPKVGPGGVGGSFKY